MIVSKICTKCLKSLPATTEYFYKSTTNKNGFKASCKSCVKDGNKLYYKNNSEKMIKDASRWARENRERKTEKNKQWQKANPDKTSQSSMLWMKENHKRFSEYRREWENNRRKNDPAFKLLKNNRRRLRSAINGQNKSATTMKLIGCTIEELMNHLESQFTDGMTWENYGKWEVDHIIPCSSFDFSQPDEQFRCFNFTNLQPLWAADNLKKSNKLQWGGK